MLKLKTPVLWPPYVKSWFIGKDSDAGRNWAQEEKGMTEDEMAGWHHWLDGHESVWTLGVGDGPGGLACCNLWGRKESDMTEPLIWSDLIWSDWKVALSSCLETICILCYIYPAQSLNLGISSLWVQSHHCLLVCNSVVEYIAIICKNLHVYSAVRFEMWKSKSKSKLSFISFQSCPTLCDLMDCSTTGLPVHHQLLEFTQTHAHQVSDAIQPSHPLSSPSPPSLNFSQHQGLFKWVISSHPVAKILVFQLQHQSFQWIFTTDFL